MIFTPLDTASSFIWSMYFFEAADFAVFLGFLDAILSATSALLFKIKGNGAYSRVLYSTTYTVFVSEADL